MVQSLRSVWREEDGQDLIEYTLLITFIVFVAAGVLGIGTSAIKGIVSLSNSQIAEGNRIAGKISAGVAQLIERCLEGKLRINPPVAG